MRMEARRAFMSAYGKARSGSIKSSADPAIIDRHSCRRRGTNRAIDPPDVSLASLDPTLVEAADRGDVASRPRAQATDGPASVPAGTMDRPWSSGPSAQLTSLTIAVIIRSEVARKVTRVGAPNTVRLLRKPSRRETEFCRQRLARRNGPKSTHIVARQGTQTPLAPANPRECRATYSSGKPPPLSRTAWWS